MKTYMEEVFSYSYSEKPFYSKLKHLLRVELIKLHEIQCSDLFGTGPQINRWSRFTAIDQTLQCDFEEDEEALHLNKKISKYLEFPDVKFIVN